MRNDFNIKEKNPPKGDSVMGGGVTKKTKEQKDGDLDYDEKEKNKSR